MNHKHSAPTPDEFPFGHSEPNPLLIPNDGLRAETGLRLPGHDIDPALQYVTGSPRSRRSRRTTPGRANLKNVTPDDERPDDDRWGRPGSAVPHRSIVSRDNDRPCVQIQHIAWDKLCRTVGKHPHERGGIFVSRVGPFYIEDFIFDDISEHEGAVYYPHAQHLNDILERQYEPLGFFFVGVGHSHPPGFWHPSGHENWGDVKAARSNLRSNENLDALFIPIIESQATTGTFRIHPFVMLRDGFRVCPARLEIVEGSQPVTSRSISLDHFTTNQKETRP